VLPVLEQWLRAELVEYQKLDKAARKHAGYLVNYYGRSVLDVDTAWKTMLRNLKLPEGREWKPYLMRHSLATILRNRGVAKWDLEGFMGHDVTGSTETYAIGRFDTVYRALEDILGEIELRSPGALRRSDAELSLSGIFPREVKMTG
jgi:site-specific recombinase XerD